MTPHQILIVAIRLLAIFWLLGVLAQVPVVIVTFENLSTHPYSTVGWLGIQFGISVVLWLFPATFASMLLRAGKTPAPAGDVALEEWRTLCFVAVGIFVLARALPDLVYWLILVSALEPFTMDQKANFVATFVEIAIGVTLVFGATGLSSLIHRLRRAGVPAGSAGG